MRYFRVWGGNKPSDPTLNFVLAWGNDRNNPRYWIISPQKNIEKLKPPTITGGYLNSSGLYTATITNNNVDDVHYFGAITFNNNKFAVDGFLVAGQSMVLSKQFTLVSGKNTAKVTNSYFRDAGYNWTSNSDGVAGGESSYTVGPTTVTVYIPALQTGISSVSYTYTNSSGSRVSVSASSSQKSISVKPNTTINWTVSSKSGYLCNNNSASTYSTSQSIGTSSTTLPTMYAKFAVPTQTDHDTVDGDIDVWFTQYTGTAQQICAKEDYESSYTSKTANPTARFWWQARPGETIYFSWYMPASGTVRASDVAKDYWTMPDVTT